MVVVWQPDDHCDCRFSDLFDYDGAVIEESFMVRAAGQSCTVYNYMEVEDGAEKDAEIHLDGGDIYARSAYEHLPSREPRRDQDALCEVVGAKPYAAGL